MYEYIRGIVSDINTEYAVLETGGVGYLIYCSTNTQRKLILSEKALLFIHLYVADDMMQLYGFHSREEREMFRKLIAVSRIGKKIALGILSAMTPSDIAMAVMTENAAAFDNVPGMGRKTAQRVILELKEKVDSTVAASSVQSEEKENMRHVAIEALLSLGYDGLAAGRAVGDVKDEDFLSPEELIKKALAVISGRK
ncbi:MAG: Holliday junction branch migration protein RuvA [Clostridia bacterium]|nr:Holliday junction branch migration protein RuvA [Clostridia bacterium]